MIFAGSLTPAVSSEAWVTLLLAFLGGSGLKSVVDLGRSWAHARSRRTPEEKEAARVDASILSVARARDELEEDNKRLRELLTEERAQNATLRQHHLADRQSWFSQEAVYRREIAELELRIRSERDEAARRYDELLEQISAVRQRHARGSDEHHT